MTIETIINCFIGGAFGTILGVFAVSVCHHGVKKGGVDILSRLLDHPRTWPVWLRHTYVIAFPILIPLHLMVLVMSMAALLITAMVAGIVLWFCSIWDGKDYFQ